jgi:Tfp pilus assembly protein PilV
MQNKINQSGQTLVFALIALSIIIVAIVALLSGTLTLKQNSRYSLDSLEATSLAEAGIDKAVASLNKSAGSYVGETETTLGNGTYTVQVTPVDSTTSKITATGYVPNSQNPKSKKKVSIQIQRGDGMSFAYGIQAGDGGFLLSGGSRVNGSVYSNNDIQLSGGATITGDAYVAGGTQPIADQQVDCTPPNCTDYIFGKSVAGNNILDVAQSFKPLTTAPINKISLKLKKTGSPGNLTIRILTDNANKPNKNGFVTQGTLNASLVSTQYSFIDVGFTTNPSLTANTLYWIVIDTTSDTNNYWSWQLDSLSGYTRGSAAWSPNWQQNPNPTWTAVNGDFAFKTWSGGKINKLIGLGSSYVNGNAYANTMTADNSSALQIGKDAYYQTESSIRVSGASCASNSHCHPGAPDPQPVVMPVSDANIQEWKDFAGQNVQNGDVNIGWPCNTPITSKKYVGNFTIGGGCSMQMDTPIWITGNLTIGGGASLSLKNSYGSSSGIIVVDGVVNLAGGSVLRGSGTAGSYMMVISTNNSQGSPYALDISGGNSSSILYAPYGAVHLSGGSNFREVSAYKIVMDGGAILTYETGVASPFFSSGPSGSFSVVKGTYQSQ